jgi:predicted N-acyltransferase
MKVQLVQSLHDISAGQWDALVGEDNPFTEHAFLLALEDSQSVGPESGWIPCHVAVYDDDALLGALPLYIKSHSYGEYIFDWSWANAAMNMGIDYYPKLVSAVPFTPATGRRILTVDGLVTGPIVDALLGGVSQVAENIGASSIHFLFITQAEKDSLADYGFLPRLTYQFHWESRGWTDFDAFLGDFRRSARRNVLRERRQVNESHLTPRFLTGPELADEHIDALFSFYQNTVARKGAIPYLTAAFFDALKGPLRHRVVSAMAFDNGRPVAGTLGFQKGKHLYGRYWGSEIDLPGLHFELCYYQHIQACLENGWTRFEAGAQGEHKIKRGLMPHATWSAHVIFHPKLAQVVQDYLPREAQHMNYEIDILNTHGPFKRCR